MSNYKPTFVFLRASCPHGTLLKCPTVSSPWCILVQLLPNQLSPSSLSWPCFPPTQSSPNKHNVWTIIKKKLRKSIGARLALSPRTHQTGAVHLNASVYWRQLTCAVIKTHQQLEGVLETRCRSCFSKMLPGPPSGPSPGSLGLVQESACFLHALLSCSLEGEDRSGAEKHGWERQQGRQIYSSTHYPAWSAADATSPAGMALCIRGSQSWWVCFQIRTKMTAVGRWGTIIVVCLTIFGTSHHLAECRQMIVLLCLASDACIMRPNWSVNMLSRRMNVYVCIRSDQSKCSENDAYGVKHCPS